MKVAVGFADADPRPARPPTGPLRPRPDRPTDDRRPASSRVSFDFLTNEAFWINVGVLVTTYGVFALGIQLNVGTTGIVNFGQAGFMAVGSYAMGICVVRWGVSFWFAMLARDRASRSRPAILVGLPSLRLRADYFAISTLAFSEIVRYLADTWDGLTGGNLGLFGYTDAWTRRVGAHRRLARADRDRAALPPAAPRRQPRRSSSS